MRFVTFGINIDHAILPCVFSTTIRFENGSEAIISHSGLPYVDHLFVRVSLLDYHLSEPLFIKSNAFMLSISMIKVPYDHIVLTSI